MSFFLFVATLAETATACTDLNDVDIVVVEGLAVDLVDELRDSDDVFLAVVNGHAQHAADPVAVRVEERTEPEPTVQVQVLHVYRLASTTRREKELN
jgi:hypothetical protein